MMSVSYRLNQKSMLRLVTIVGFIATLGINTASAIEPNSSWWSNRSPEHTLFAELPAQHTMLFGRGSLTSSLTEPLHIDILSPRDIMYGISIINTPGFELGLHSGHQLGIDTYREATLQGINTVNDSLGFGFFTQGRYGDYSLGTRVSKEVSQGHEGMLGEIMAGYGKKLSDNLGLSLEVTTTWADENYMESYYGVDTAQSVQSGLQTYLPEAGFKNASLHLTACYQLSELWFLGAQVGYMRLFKEVADSPTMGNDRIDEFITGLQFQYNLPAFGARRSRNLLSSPCSP